MPVVISSLNKEKVFSEKEVINVGSRQDCDYVLDLGFDLLLTIQYNPSENKCNIVNTFSNDKVLFKGQPMGQKLEIDNICKLMIADSNEFISIKLIAASPVLKTVEMIGNEDFTEDDMKNLYGSDINAVTKVKIEKRRADLEKVRVSIRKQVAFVINELKHKISTNFKTSLFLHIALFLGALISSFAVSNYLMGLKIQETKDFLHLPTNIKVLFIFTLLTFGIGLLLKQGTYLFLQNKTQNRVSPTAKIAENFMLFISSIFMIGIYAINVIYYLNANGNIAFGILISAFFVGIMSTLAISCGYFKSSGVELSVELDKHEYREDFENVIKDYQKWIELFVNNLSKTKINHIKDRLFTLQLKSVGETIIGILTAPFLAYGVSNTLAMCFPEAAGWVRISGLRLSPVFLVLATFLIIFAFFAFVNAFLCTKKIQGSNVIKQDGFSNYMHHGVDIYGLEGIRKFNIEKVTSLVIAIAIIFIEFSMNISYFMSEIGGDLQGIFLSLIAALVPTALLIAETYMLSQTKFYIYASDELIAKIDKD